MSEVRKPCRTCGGNKRLDDFRRDSRRKDGRSTQCRACARVMGAVYRARNVESVRQRERINSMVYRMRHPERRRMIAAESRRRRAVMRSLQG